MSRNRIRRANKLQARRLGRIFAVCFVLTLFGWLFVFMKHRIIKLSDEIAVLEKTAAEVEEGTARLMAENTKLASGPELVKKLHYYGIEMVPISDTRVRIIETPAWSAWIARKKGSGQGGFRTTVTYARNQAER